MTETGFQLQGIINKDFPRDPYGEYNYIRHHFALHLNFRPRQTFLEPFQYFLGLLSQISGSVHHCEDRFHFHVFIRTSNI